MGLYSLIFLQENTMDLLSFIKQKTIHSEEIIAKIHSYNHNQLGIDFIICCQTRFLLQKYK